MKIKSKDTVKIIKGKDKGKTGKVIKALPRENRVVVEGVNLVKKHAKPRQKGKKGEIVTLPRPIPVANVMLVCPHCHQPTRVGYRIVDGKKYRVCKKCSQIID